MRKRFDIEQTKNRWPGILEALGVEPKLLSKHNGPCPFCGGKDRFRFTDHEGMGLWVCNQCGTGNGVHFAKKFLDVDFVTAMKKIEEILPSIEIKPEPKRAPPRVMLNRYWNSASPLSAHGDPVADYLINRGVWVWPASSEVRSRKGVTYFDEGRRVGSYDAMIARVRDDQGKPTTLHVTYLSDGKKAAVPSPKKILSEMGSGAHIRLFPAEKVLAVAEGIETALAVRAHTGMAVWAGISAGGLRNLVIPNIVEELHIFADNDAESFTGQAAAYHLANRVATKSKRCVRVEVPRHGDWADLDNWENGGC